MNSPEDLLIDAFALAAERATMHGQIPLARLPRLASMLLEASGVLTYAIQGRIDDEGRPGATMHLQADLVLCCQRCSSPVPFRLDRRAVFRFAANEDEIASRPIEDDEFEDVVASHQMPVAPWVEDEAILSLPVVPRHESCRLPASPEPTFESVDPHPFAVLAGFKPGRRAN